MEGFARNYPAGSETGFLLMGPCGVGKTHLAVAALRQLMLRGHGGRFYDYRELLKEMQASYSPDHPVSEMSVLEPVLDTEVLLIDDIGASKPSPWALETIGHILNKRYNDKRVTLLTTNYLDWRSRRAVPAPCACPPGRSMPALARNRSPIAWPAGAFPPLRDVPHRGDFLARLSPRNPPGRPGALLDANSESLEAPKCYAQITENIRPIAFIDTAGSDRYDSRVAANMTGCVLPCSSPMSGIPKGFHRSEQGKLSLGGR